ncbi:hypothetical protein RHCRD62_10606 [Rhodococcus sp. RD6.2]|nr:hypothetical protein RHCRD62_10606 [Rhodococcus sp. RD6.2]
MASTAPLARLVRPAAADCIDETAPCADEMAPWAAFAAELTASDARSRTPAVVVTVVSLLSLSEVHPATVRETTVAVNSAAATRFMCRA